MNKIILFLAFAMLIGAQAHSEDSVAPENTTQVEPRSTVGSDAPVVTASPTPQSEPSAPQSDDSEKHHVKKKHKANFGALVSAEAHKLNADDLNGQQKMGAWVSDQRRAKDSNKDASQGAGASSGHSSNSDGRNANSSGPSQGQSSNHRK